MRFSSEKNKVLIINTLTKKTNNKEKNMTRLKLICYVGALLLALIGSIVAVKEIMAL
jgi:hypothetical protein